jgi:hypothetical protein
MPLEEISEIFLLNTFQNDLAMRNTADVTGSKVSLIIIIKKFAGKKNSTCYNIIVLFQFCY